LFVGEDEWRLDGELSMLFFLELLEKCLWMSFNVVLIPIVKSFDIVSVCASRAMSLHSFVLCCRLVTGMRYCCISVVIVTQFFAVAIIVFSFCCSWSWLKFDF
jgi:hypothetical protein